MNLPDTIQWFVYQQDYLWFLVMLGWAALAVGWSRLRLPQSRPAWLPWAAAAAVLTGGVQISQLVTPVELKPFVPPRLAWDLALGAIQALLIGGLAWALSHSRGWPRWSFLVALAPALAAAGLRYTHPLAGSVMLFILILGITAVLVHATRAAGVARVALWLQPLSVLLATNGPLAGARADTSHRITDISLYGLPAAACLLAGLIAASRLLLRPLPGESSIGVVTVRPVSLRQLVRMQALWLAFGLGLAAVMSAWARAGFENNLLARARMAAELIDRRYLESVLGPEFRVNATFNVRFNGIDMPHFRSAFLASNELMPLADELSAVELANPDVDTAMVITLRGGQLVLFAYSSRAPKPINEGENGNYGTPDATTWASWINHHDEFIGPVNFYYGYLVQARAPLLSVDRRMLGWLTLELGVAHWLAAQAQARLLAFVVIALGNLLLLTDFLRRQREREKDEEARRAEIALGANRLKAAFLAKVSHELRTPIQSLLGFSELLRQRVTDDPKAAGWLASLRQHGELMTRLVNDLIDLGALESGAFQLSPRATDAAALTSQAIESFTPRAETKGLSLACFIDPAVPAWVSLDGERFRQVLINLVGNALKFTERGGVTVALRHEPGDRLVLTVRDTGPGIAPAEQEKLFTAFSRLEVTADKEGSGLGLALSAGLCTAMGGALHVESDGRSGSCFTATFCTPPAINPGDTTINRDPAALRGRRVLVVDDNPLVRELFIAFLTEHGAMCAAAGTGAEALAQGDASEFDAIILDLALPDGDGATFAGPLRERARDARIVGVSAHAGSADRQRALAAGMDAFLTKPVSLGALAAAITDGPAVRSPAFGTADALRERLARQFSRELPAQMTELDAAIAAENWLRVRSLAHYLKNSAVVVRDDQLFSVCTGLEESAITADPAGVRRWRDLCQPGFNHWLTGRNEPFPLPAAVAAENRNHNPP